jgi:hypothetical protein
VLQNRELELMKLAARLLVCLESTECRIGDTSEAGRELPFVIIEIKERQGRHHYRPGHVHKCDPLAGK